MRIALLATVVLAGCGGPKPPPSESGLDSGTAYDEAMDVCGAATTAEACRDASTDTWDCGAVLSAECDADPYAGDTEWRFDGCVPTNVTCTQFTVWLRTEEGCRAFDACHAPSALYPSCDPAIECP